MSGVLDRIAMPRMGTSVRWLLGSPWVRNIGDAGDHARRSRRPRHRQGPVPGGL